MLNFFPQFKFIEKRVKVMNKYEITSEQKINGRKNIQWEKCSASVLIRDIDIK